MANKNENVTVTPVENPTGTYPTLPKTQAPVKQIQNPGKSADAELPVQKPGAGAPVQTMSQPDAVALPQVQNREVQNGNAVVSVTGPKVRDAAYTSMNQQVWGEGGTGKEGYEQVLEQEKLNQQQSGTGSNPYTDEDLRKQLIAAGINPDLLDEDSHKGGWTQNKDTAIAGGGTGAVDEKFYLDGDWYYYPGQARPVTGGNSGADEQLLSDGAYAYIQHCKAMYENATTDEERAYWHNEAEKVRARAGYSGGADGSMYLTHGALGIQNNQNGIISRPGSVNISGGTGAVTGGSGSGSGIEGLDYVQTEELKALLEAWKSAAQEQANGQIDYATQQAITQLERALQDAQPQFKEQAESVSLAERQSMDNAALYAQLRGDQGGIGQEQYNSIQNTAAQNRLAVQQAQTKLSTDTARQIEDLRAQGEFEKADKALEITQNYLSQLIGLEQWALEANLSVDQFNKQLEQWKAEYDMAMLELQMGQERWEQEFAFQQEQAAIGNNQWQQQFDYEKILNQLQAEQDTQNQSAELGWAMLEVGMVNALTEDQIAAMGFQNRAQAQEYYNALVTQSSKGSGGTENITDVYQWLADNGAVDQASAYNLLVTSGKFSSTEANNFSKFFESWSGYDDATVGLSQSFDYIMAQAQTMTREEAEKYLKGMVTKGRKNGGITEPEMRYILGTARFNDEKAGSSGSGSYSNNPNYSFIPGM